MPADPDPFVTDHHASCDDGAVSERHRGDILFLGVSTNGEQAALGRGQQSGSSSRADRAASEPLSGEVRARPTKQSRTSSQFPPGHASTLEEPALPQAPTPAPTAADAPVLHLKQPPLRASESPRTPTIRRTRGTPRKLLTPAQVDARIADILRRPLAKKQLSLMNRNNNSRSNNHEMDHNDNHDNGFVGSNYVFSVIPRSDPEKRVVKIGVTRGSEQLRLRQINSACRHVLIEQQDDPEHAPIALYQKAEKLIHAELHNFLYEFDCRCGSGGDGGGRVHGEYFDIDADTAREIVQRWRRFCKMDPYGSDGYLKPFWAHRLRNRAQPLPPPPPSLSRASSSSSRLSPSSFSSLSSLGEMGEGQRRDEQERVQNSGKQDEWEIITDHDKRRRRWARFVSPSKLETLWYDAAAPLARTWRWRWQVVALLQGFALAVLAFPSLTALLHFGHVVAAVVAEAILGLDVPVITTLAAVWRIVEEKVTRRSMS